MTEGLVGNTDLRDEFLHRAKCSPGTAHLTDRVLLAEGESQVCGTQMTMVDGEYRPRDLRDPETVDERRAAVGLSAMAEYRELMRRT